MQSKFKIIITTLCIVCLARLFVCESPSTDKSQEINGKILMSSTGSGANTMLQVPKVEDLNFTEIVQHCNESYNIVKNYLQELNDTGSYPDETEQAPMVSWNKKMRKTN
jgi:hypothetical protein